MSVKENPDRKKKCVLFSNVYKKSVKKIMFFLEKYILRKQNYNKTKKSTHMRKISEKIVTTALVRAPGSFLFLNERHVFVW